MRGKRLRAASTQRQQRWPRPEDADAVGDALSHATRREAEQAKERKRKADSACGVMPPSDDFPRHDEDDRAASPALEAPSSNDANDGRAVRLTRSADLAVSKAVADQAERETRDSACAPASGAAGRADSLDDRRLDLPKLDLDVGMNDSCTALVSSQWPPGARREAGPLPTAPLVLFCPADPRMLRLPSERRRSTSRRGPNHRLDARRGRRSGPSLI